jgi:hypothetical protein
MLREWQYAFLRLQTAGLIPCFRHHATSRKKEEASALAPLGFNFEKDLQHDRYPEWKARNAENHPHRQLVFSKDITQQLRGSVSHLRLREEVPFGCDVRHQPDDPDHLIERAQVVSRGGEYVQSRDMRGFASLCDVVLSAQPAYELRFMPDDRQNATEIKQGARLNTFNVGADRSGREGQLNAERRKPALRVRRLRALWAHHLPECAPPSTCSTSPVTLRASVR